MPSMSSRPRDVILYEGKAKQLIPWAEDEACLIQRFKDSATAFNGVKYAEFEGKGALNQRISAHLYGALHERDIPTHFIKSLNDTDMLVQRLTIVPLEVVVRNVVAGSLAKRLGLPESTPLTDPIVETYYKRDELGDPLLAPVHVFALGICDRDTLDELSRRALAINDALRPIFEQAHLRLVDFKLEFGHDSDGALLLGDEISPDTCRLWDADSSRRLDKDVFRRDLADLIDTYNEVAQRLGLKTSTHP